MSSNPVRVAVANEHIAHLGPQHGLLPHAASRPLASIRRGHLDQLRRHAVALGQQQPIVADRARAAKRKRSNRCCPASHTPTARGHPWHDAPVTKSSLTTTICCSPREFRQHGRRVRRAAAARAPRLEASLAIVGNERVSSRPADAHDDQSSDHERRTRFAPHNIFNALLGERVVRPQRHRPWRRRGN